MSWGTGKLVEDPPDPNYTEVALPIIPTTSIQPIVPRGDLTSVQADAFNALFVNLEQDIGLSRAMLTAFDRASGALAANDSYWVNRQLQGARLYSSQLADVLDVRPQLLADLQEALSTIDGLPFAIIARNLSNIKANLVINGLSAEQSQLLAELGMDARGQEEILNALLETEFAPGALPEDTVATFPDFLTDRSYRQHSGFGGCAPRVLADQRVGQLVYLPLVVRTDSSKICDREKTQGV